MISLMLNVTDADHFCSKSKMLGGSYTASIPFMNENYVSESCYHFIITKVASYMVIV